ncbi:ABC transporter permease [Pedobacter sp. GR22-6]|uniref:ABC transporter permease n=1 Tax=Pedobacter sp. GR22-6 TaxID=3127957 RepID=UPI00307D9C43
MKNKRQYWTIKPLKSPVNLDMGAIFSHRYLLLKLVQREIRAQYHQTLLGPIWFILQPILSTLIFTFSFGKLAGIPTNNIPPFLFYLSGIVMWTFFAESINKTANIFKDNAKVFSKFYFPRVLVPLATIGSLLLRFAIQLSVLCLLSFLYHLKGYPIQLRMHLLVLPILLTNAAALGLGIGLIVSSITIRYRDFSFLVAFGIQLMMYVSPVIFPQSATPKKLLIFIKLNPISTLLEHFRYAWFGKGNHDMNSLLYTTTFAVIILLSGLVVFKKAQQNFIDYF